MNQEALAQEFHYLANMLFSYSLQGKGPFALVTAADGPKQPASPVELGAESEMTDLVPSEGIFGK